MNYIDAHVHVWSDDYCRYPFSPRHPVADAVLPRFLPEDILRHAHAVGVNRVVLVQMSYYECDNRYMLEVIQQHPQVFAGIAIVDRDQDVGGEMKRLARQGVRGFRVHPEGRPASGWLDGDGYTRMFRAAAEQQLGICALIGPGGLEALRKRCEQFPDAPVIIDHLCRIGVDGVIRNTQIDELCAMARFPKLMLKVSAFYALGKKSPPYDDLSQLIQRVYEAFGPDRLMWASDSPFQVMDNHTYGQSIGLVHDRLGFLDEQDRDLILRGTAEKFFFQGRMA